MPFYSRGHFIDVSITENRYSFVTKKIFPSALTPSFTIMENASNAKTSSTSRPAPPYLFSLFGNENTSHSSLPYLSQIQTTASNRANTTLDIINMALETIGDDEETAGKGGDGTQGRGQRSPSIMKKQGNSGSTRIA
eukprot:jgi/Psemu1/49005/gm1.49005_g